MGTYECQVKLGDKVKDTEREIDGIVTSVIFHLYGETRIRVTPSTITNADGSKSRAEWCKPENVVADGAK